MSTHLLIATIPERRASFERLFLNLPKQTRQPDSVHIVLDGFVGDDSSLLAGLPASVVQACAKSFAVLYPTRKRLGPGGRWRIIEELPTDATLVVLDDDMSIFNAPALLAVLSEVVRPGVAAACAGICVGGRPALGNAPGGDLVCMGAAAMAVCVKDMLGFGEFAQKLKEQLAFNPLGDCGDDEAVVSAYLWSKGVKLQHVPVLGLASDQGAQAHSQMRKRLATAKPLFWQREAIAKKIHWPWV